MRRIRDPWAPATKDQLKYARDLGIEVPEGVTKGAISELIDKALDNREPTADQLAFASALGIDVPDGATFDEVSTLIDTVVRTKSIEAMQTNPALRAGKVIMHLSMPYRITFIGGLRGRYVANLEPIKSGVKGYGKRTVMIITIATAREVDLDALRRAFD